MQVVILAALADQNYYAQLAKIEFGLCSSNKFTGFIDPLHGFIKTWIVHLDLISCLSSNVNSL